MREFVIGQRWVNDAELQLGLGTVLAVEQRTVTILFQSTGETRIYARQSAPLTRITFTVGDTIRTRDGLEISVESVSDAAGLVCYCGRNQQGVYHEVEEILLDYHLRLNRPAERLFSGQIDIDKWYNLRYQTLQELNRLAHSRLRGLSGCRTSLIPHQLYIAHEVAHRYAPRVLLADEVGLGKTIEAGLIIHQQLLTERVQRVLIVVPEALLHQWLVEMLRRFNLHFSIFDAARHQAMGGGEDPQNPFQQEQLVLCSLDFLVNDSAVLDDALAGEWDLLVVDEAHHLRWTPQQPSAEYRAIEQLAAVTRGVLLLTATPEQLGKAGHFARLRLLDPRRFPDFAGFIEEEKRYEPVADAIEQLFGDAAPDPRTLETLRRTIGEDDKRVLPAALTENNPDHGQIAQRKTELVALLLDRHGTGRVLFRNTRAGVKGFPKRKLSAYALPLPPAYKKTGAADSPGAAVELIYHQHAAPEHPPWTRIDPRFSWLQDKLIALRPARVLVIAASAHTVRDLAEALRQRAGMHLAVFHEGMSIVERDRAAAYFADKDEGCQALLCSEIGSEGRNFQFAHHLVLFDLPLNPDLLEQRIGRLDRIGQTQTIHIHVPWLQDSAQAVLFHWYHLGLNAFEKPCPAGATVFRQMETDLLTALAQPQKSIDELLSSTRACRQQLDAALHKGRDRLLEYNSCRPAMATALLQQAQAEDRESTLAAYMDSIFDCFGVHTEEHSSGRYIIRPGENMLTAFPQLPDDGMTLTYDRDIALANENIHYLSWDHPMVTGAMDSILSSELGNTAVIAIKHSDMAPGTLLLESIYIVESASSHSLQTRRYLPPTTIRIVIDATGKQHGTELDHRMIRQQSIAVDRTTASRIVNAKLDVLKQLTQRSEQQAHKQAPAILAAARQRASRLLTGEINRLTALNKVNQNVRPEEIDYFKQQLQALDRVLDEASLRLDALRVIIAT